MPALLAPSVSRTMMSGAYAPLTTGAGAVPVDESVTLFATDGSISEMASIEARMPSPIAVRRPVARLCRAFSSAA